MPWGGEGRYKYVSVRIGMVWPSVENPGFFVVGGMEVDDKFEAINGIVRIIQESEAEGLALTSLFNSMTDAYVGMFADGVYIDASPGCIDYRNALWDYLDKNNLRAIDTYDVPHDLAYRWGKIADLNLSGKLAVDKTSIIFSDVQGISREHMKDADAEKKHYRLNALSYLVAGFAKNPPMKPLDLRSFGISSGGGESGWMGH